MKRVRNLLMLAVIALVFFPGCAKPVGIKVKFTEGQELNYVHTTDTVITTDMMGIPLDIRQKMIIHIIHMPLQLNEKGEQRIKQVVKRIQMDMNMGMIQMNFDTRDPQGGFMENIFKIIIDKPLYVTVDAQGQIVAMEGIEEVAKELDKASLGGLAPHGQGGPGLGSVFGEQLPKSLLQTTYFPVPPNPVKVGQSWTTTRHLSQLGFGDLNYSETLTLDKIEKGVAYIRSEPRLTGDLINKKGGIPVPGSNIHFRISKIDMQADYEVDIGQGRLLKQTVDMDIEMEGADPSFGSLPIKMKSLQTTELEDN